VYAVATCRGSVLRGTAENTFGDDVATGAVHSTNHPARIKPRTHTVFDPTTQARRIVSSHDMRIQSDTDIQPGDQFRDDTHGITYAVIDAHQPDQQGRESDLLIQLRLVTAAS
jgi:hypothetical protein